LYVPFFDTIAGLVPYVACKMRGRYQNMHLKLVVCNACRWHVFLLCVGILLPCVWQPFLKVSDHDFNFVLFMVEQMWGIYAALQC